MSEQLSSFYFLVENALRDMSIEPAQSKGEMPGQWNIAFGDMAIGIDVWSIPEQDNKVVFQAQSALLKVPEKNQEAFYRELLEINYIMYGIAFSVVDDSVFLKTMRDAHDISHNDVLYAIRLCGFYGEHYGNELHKKYGAEFL